MARLFLFTVCILVTGVTRAEEESGSPRWGVLLPAISLSSDYRFNGMSLSNRQPAVQGSLYLWRPDGYYAGIWASQVDFLDGETSLEIDTYVGRNLKREGYELNFELMYMSFNDDDVAGPTYDFLQVKSGVKRQFGGLSLGVSALWSSAGSAGSGRVRQVRSETEYRVNEYVKASAVVGRQWLENAVDRTYWDAGLTFEWRKLDLDVRYSGTSLDKSQCFYTDWCEPGVFARLTLASY